MKKILIFCIFAAIITVISCNQTAPIKILKWGPSEATIGTVPNKQTDGKMGIWIDVESTENLGEAQVLFDGNIEPTSVEPRLITAGIPTEQISVAGEKKVEIKIVKTGQIVPVGTFKAISKTN